MVKPLSAMQESRVQSLGWEDPLKKKMAAHSSSPAWKIPWMEEPVRLQSTGSQRVRHDGSAQFSRSVMSNSLRPHGLYSLWNSPGQNTRVGSLSLLQGIFKTQGSNRSPVLLADSLPAEPQSKPKNIGVGSLSLLQQIF